MPDFRVRALEHTDRAQWEPLWRAYLIFYRAQWSDEVANATFARIFDPLEPVHALVAERGGDLIGFTHYLFQRSTWLINSQCYLQDLYVGEAVRGSGVGRALIAASSTRQRKRARRACSGTRTRPTPSRGGSTTWSPCARVSFSIASIPSADARRAGLPLLSTCLMVCGPEAFCSGVAVGVDRQGFWMVSRRLTKRSLAIAKANAQAGADAALTIAARTQRLLAPGRRSDKAREARLMVQEKIDAAIEGAFAAQMAWGSFFIKAAFGGVRTPNDVSAGLTAIAEAATAPARRAVRANARRLTGVKASL